ncbi:MAG: hypothetical protein KU28_00670 [Sulfurovum sp. PC08-66]|nr:MAG: hypothetical protein KU28_00670 [Sulfurovum sp. PC08-66]KIM12481.1 MAG: hypothetical protein KU37_00785 [Sulfuricurvum sp. PC08-66]
MQKVWIVSVLVALLVAGCSSPKEEASAHAVAAHETHKSEHNFTKAHWGYEGEYDAAHWSLVNPECGTGKAQSPIDLTPKQTVPMAANHVVEFHESTHAELSHEVDNGHAIKIDPIGDEGIELLGVHYKLLQFHFHGRSEHTVEGKPYDMELHLVHQNAQGQLAVVGVLMREGAHNNALEDVLAHLEGGDLNVTVNDLLPADKTHYYHYMGSLTTPPCSENVAWYIFQEPIELDAQQIGLFRTHHANNFRPVQPLHGRVLEAK